MGKTAFKALDDDNSKSLEEKEFVPLAIEQLGCDNDSASSLFKQIDVSGNGSVSFAEFDSWLSSGGGIDKLLQYKALKQAFKNADKDGNLSLGVDELGGMDNFKVYSQIIDEFKKADNDKSGSLCL